MNEWKSVQNFCILVRSMLMESNDIIDAYLYWHMLLMLTGYSQCLRPVVEMKKKNQYMSVKHEGLHVCFFPLSLTSRRYHWFEFNSVDTRLPIKIQRRL